MISINLFNIIIISIILLFKGMADNETINFIILIK